MTTSYTRGQELMRLPPDQWPPGLAAYRSRLDEQDGGSGESGDLPFVHYAHVIEGLPLTYHAYEPHDVDREALLRFVKGASSPPAETATLSEASAKMTDEQRRVLRHCQAYEHIHEAHFGEGAPFPGDAPSAETLARSLQELARMVTLEVLRRKW
jgi:hypothetical protein